LYKNIIFQSFSDHGFEKKKQAASPRNSVCGMAVPYDAKGKMTNKRAKKRAICPEICA
jgi:hypothetical protein